MLVRPKQYGYVVVEENTHILILPSSPPDASMHGSTGFHATALQLSL
jgi:hypothetical protein